MPKTSFDNRKFEEIPTGENILVLRLADTLESVELMPASSVDKFQPVQIRFDETKGHVIAR